MFTSAQFTSMFPRKLFIEVDLPLVNTLDQGKLQLVESTVGFNLDMDRAQSMSPIIDLNKVNQYTVFASEKRAFGR